MFFPWGRLAPSALRTLRVEDAVDCARIHAEGFAYPWSVQEFETLIAASNALGLAAVDPANGGMRGFALSRQAADEAEVLTIAVDPALRRSGVGAALMRAHLNQVANAGARRLFLEVDAGNPAALALYERLRFQRIGERKGYYKQASGAAATALTMRLDLA